VGLGTQAQLAPARGCSIFCSSIAAIASGIGPHALADLRIAAQSAFQPDIDVLVLVGRDPGLALDEILAAENGPASIEVWISSPVRSRKPVLMKATRCFAARMHSLRLTEVRRSSSMMPSFTV
jgi:hypothetical protein